MGDKNSLTKLEPAPAAHRAIGSLSLLQQLLAGRQGGPSPLTLSTSVLLIAAGNHQASDVAALPQPALGSRVLARHYLSNNKQDVYRWSLRLGHTHYLTRPPQLALAGISFLQQGQEPTLKVNSK